ncbi:cytosine permease [Govanella unica]|uniref:Cytosine permease n=1 Tax=Govanella unica TaxID=2975056 RepID=A0A9X3Z7Q2_9PROT|nr:cytosine permease [Govania unica]MDA5194239.1 cytosine permease [Govania unica]
MSTKLETPKAGTEEFSHGSVPESATVAGWNIALVLLGMVLSLPCFLIGAQLGASFGLEIGAQAVVIGALILTFLACLTGMVAQSCRLTTAMIIQTAFGMSGAKVINLVLAITIFGWFGVVTKLFGESLAHVAMTSGLPDLDPRLYMVVGGGLMVLTTVFGFSAIQRVSKVIAPFLIMGLVATAYIAARLVSREQLMATPLDAPSLGIGVSIVIGGLAVGATIFPDFSRFARSRRDALLAAVIGFGLGVSAAFILSAIPSVATGEAELPIILASLGLGLPALALILCSAWTANSSNLYSSALAMATISPKTPHLLLTITAGVLGVLLAVLGISDYLIPFLTLLGIAIPPIAGIYVADFFLVRRAAYLNYGKAGQAAFRPLAFVAWVAGIGIGSATANYLFSLSGIPAVDSVLTAFTVYLVGSKLPFGQKVAPSASRN